MQQGPGQYTETSWRPSLSKLAENLEIAHGCKVKAGGAQPLRAKKKSGPTPQTNICGFCLLTFRARFCLPWCRLWFYDGYGETKPHAHSSTGRRRQTHRYFDTQHPRRQPLSFFCCGSLSPVPEMHKSRGGGGGGFLCWWVFQVSSGQAWHAAGCAPLYSLLLCTSKLISDENCLQADRQTDRQTTARAINRSLDQSVVQ